MQHVISESMLRDRAMCLPRLHWIALMPCCCSWPAWQIHPCCSVYSWGGDSSPVPQTGLTVTTKNSRANSMLLSTNGISGIRLYPLCKCTIPHTAPFTLGAFYQYAVLFRSSYTGIGSPYCLLGWRMLGSFFPHDKLPLFIWTTIALHVLYPTSANPTATVASASSGWTRSAAETPH